MENNFHGDLADIFLPNTGDPPGVSVSISDWQYSFDQPDHEPQIIQKSTRSTNDQSFGQPFSSLLADPFNHDQATSTPCFFGTGLDELEQQADAAATRTPLGFHEHKINDNHNHNIFSKMLQISPNNAAKSTLSPNNDHHDHMITPSSSSKRCLIESTATTLQISSPRNPGIKRRKSQAKKVVCIPAPAPVNSRPTGEVVPSDLWAWRKYGQKPIKGSPYPRGYYRCSSSKGCSARKQVERSRTDPNMLVITYTSEHNHPWPTQRNALAGSTRTPLPPKTTTSTSPPATEQPPEKDTTEDHDGTLLRFPVKDEALEEHADDKLGLHGIFPQVYRPELLPEMPEHAGGGQSDDFFSGLGEIDVDPISMLLNQGFLGGEDEEGEDYNKDLDPFSLS